MNCDLMAPPLRRAYLPLNISPLIRWSVLIARFEANRGKEQNAQAVFVHICRANLRRAGHGAKRDPVRVACTPRFGDAAKCGASPARHSYPGVDRERAAGAARPRGIYRH